MLVVPGLSEGGGGGEVCLEQCMLYRFNASLLNSSSRMRHLVDCFVEDFKFGVGVPSFLCDLCGWGHWNLLPFILRFLRVLSSLLLISISLTFTLLWISFLCFCTIWCIFSTLMPGTIFYLFPKTTQKIMFRYVKIVRSAHPPIFGIGSIKSKSISI